MRIAFYAWESLHTIPVGGAAAHITELAAALHRCGHEIHVFARLGAGQPTYELIAGVHYHRCPIDLDPDFVTEMNNMGNSFAYFMGETEAYQNAPFDIVHAHDWLSVKGAVQAKNDRGRPVVLTLHSTEFGRCGNHSFEGVSRRIREIEAEGAYVADRVITVSAQMANEVKRLYGVPDDKLRTIYNAINCSRFDGEIDAGTCRERHGIGRLDPMVLFVGRLCVQKAPDLLLEALPGILEHRSDAKAVFVGDGYLRGELQHRAHELGIRDAVRFPGWLDGNGELVDLFKSSDIVCVPSRNEPFGIVVLEAWAAGKPVVATRNGGPCDFVTHGEDGFLVYDNAQSICWGINTMFGDLAQSRWMGARGRVKAAFGFSWDTIASQTEGVYRELAD